MFLIDRYGRPLTKLRVSVTEKCNLKCVFCHREGITGRSSYEANPSEIGLVVKAMVELGVNSVKITGGEPLMREDIIEIVSRISRINGIIDLSMTTNGTLLSKYAVDLRNAGLMRVNINLPSINSKTYSEVTGGDLSKALDGVFSAIDAGFNPIKINMLMLRGINEDEVWDLIKFTSKNGLILQLIELEPLGKAITKDFYEKHHLELDFIEEELKKHSLESSERIFQKRRVYKLRGGAVVEVVRPIENTEFCFNCFRIRLTPDLKFKPCLMRNDNLVEIEKPLNINNVFKAIVEANRRRKPFYK